MKILFWIPYPKEGPSNRYRVEQYLPYLKREETEYVIRPFWSISAYKVLYTDKNYLKKIYFFLSGTITRISDILQLFRYDIVFIHREAYPIGGVFFERILRLLRKPFIFDFDDAIYLPFSSSSNLFIGRFRKPKRVSKIIKMSSRVIVGNSYLSQFASAYNGAVSIIPTSVDTEKYFPLKKENKREIIIGWMGSPTTSSFLKMLEETFLYLFKKNPHIKLKIVGGSFSIKGISNIINKPWSLEEELNDLKSFDIGIMPMPDNDWTRGKCGFKAILYMSMGIPCVCSPVGVNNEIINDGFNGFLASTEQEWIDKLSHLIGDASLREKIGKEGRRTVEERYSVKVNAPKFLEVFQKVYQEKYR